MATALRENAEKLLSCSAKTYLRFDSKIIRNTCTVLNDWLVIILLFYFVQQEGIKIIKNLVYLSIDKEYIAYMKISKYQDNLLFINSTTIC